MAITYYQAILAFCLQDGPEALTQVRRLRKGHLGWTIRYGPYDMGRIIYDSY